MPAAQSDYVIPRFGSPSDRIHKWCLEALAEGEAWLGAQRPAQGWANALQILSEVDGSTAADGLSSVGYNKTKRVAREQVAGLSNFRHEGEFKPTWDNSLYDTARTLTDLDNNWYTETSAWKAHRAGLQYAVGLGTAYFYQVWDKHFHSPYRGDIRLSAFSPADVFFVQLPKDHNIQNAYAVIIREELPINLAKANWYQDNRAFADSLVPDREQPREGWMARGLQKVQQFVAPALRVAGRLGGNPDQRGSFPTVDIFHMYVMDGTLNETGFPVQMGPKGANWSYIVPSLGDPLPAATINPATGNFFTVPAGPEHCRLFPLRRYITFSRTGTAYDGSSPWWHGQVPLARLSLGDWAWEALGSSVIPELKTMQDGIVATMRGIEDSIAARLDPPVIYDDQTISSTYAHAVNPRKAGVRAAANLMQNGTPFVYPAPPGTYDVPSWITQYIADNEERMDYIASTKDLVAIAKAKQVPGADTLEKLLEMAGPIVQDNIRQLEEPLKQLGEWRKAYYFQFYTCARMLTITGPTGIQTDVKYEPEKLIPLQQQESPESRVVRARGYLDSFRYVVTESGINEINRMSTKLLYLQLSKAGFPIDWWTMAKVLQISNFGPPPEGANTVMERWTAQKMMEIELAVEQQIQGAAKMAESGLAAPGGGPGGPGAEGEGNPPTGPESNGNSGGRPPSFTGPPRMVSKEGGQRTTVTTSQ